MMDALTRESLSLKRHKDDLQSQRQRLWRTDIMKVSCCFVDVIKKYNDCLIIDSVLRIKQTNL